MTDYNHVAREARTQCVERSWIIVELQTRSAHPLPTLIPSGGPALPDFAGLFYKLKFHDGGERHEGCASYTKSTWCWHWSCASTLCKNSWKTPNVEYYTLTKAGSAPKTVQDAYLKVLGKRKEDVNFNNQVICSMHWSCGKRSNLEDLPSIKFTEAGNQESQKVKQEHWNCAGYALHQFLAL